LSGSQRSPSRRGRLRRAPIVHATIATAISSATSDSSSIQPIVSRAFFRCSATALAAAVALAGCVVTPPAPPTLPARYEPVAWSALHGWADDRLHEAWPAFRVGCAALVAAAATRPLWEALCSAGEAVVANDERAVRAFFETHFIAYRVVAPDGRDTGLVTGYYEPLLEGSRTSTERHRVPLYGPPDDLLAIDLASLHPELAGKRLRGRVDGRRVVPYWTRADIESGHRPPADKALAYVADPVDAFFLEIQGSGRVRLADGSALRLGYADQNGHPYRSIGRVLVERGELTVGQASLAGIRDWTQRNPGKLRELLDENPSYVFFREVPPFAPGTLEASIDGPIGSLGVPLLRERAIAVDPRAVPLGAPGFLATTYPLSARPLERLVLAQDTGGAIRGAVRADFFWGFGDDAGREAGRMRQDGRVFLLWPKGVPLPAEQIANQQPGKP
jgi:membrane-bound lytic murein transglycosylase A